VTIDPSTGVRGFEPGRQDLAYASQFCFQKRQPHYRAAHFICWLHRRFTQPQHNKSLDASGGGVFRIIIGPAMLE